MIVVIGLGPMGAAIATRLAESGFHTLGIDKDEGRMSDWLAGMRPDVEVATAVDLDEVDWSTVAVVVIAVRLAAQVKVVLDDLERYCVGRDLTAVIVTTLGPDAARQLCSTASVNRELWCLVECPVSGGPAGAADGTLTALVARDGGLSIPSELASLLRTFAATIEYFAELGQPSFAKLLNNTIGAYNAVALGQMLKRSAAVGLSPSQMLNIVNSSSGGSWMSKNFATFAHDLLAKDVGLLASEGVSLPPVTEEDLLRLDTAIPEYRGLLDNGGYSA